MAEEPFVRVTLQDVYDLLKDHTANVERRFSDIEDTQAAHEARDTAQFGALNIKVYGVLAGLLAGFVTLAAVFAK